MTRSYKAGAAVRNTAVNTSKSIQTAARSTAGAVKGFWSGLTGKTIVTTKTAVAKR